MWGSDLYYEEKCTSIMEKEVVGAGLSKAVRAQCGTSAQSGENS